MSYFVTGPKRDQTCENGVKLDRYIVITLHHTKGTGDGNDCVEIEILHREWDIKNEQTSVIGLWLIIFRWRKNDFDDEYFWWEDDVYAQRTIIDDCDAKI